MLKGAVHAYVTVPSLNRRPIPIVSDSNKKFRFSGPSPRAILPAPRRSAERRRSCFVWPQSEFQAQSHEINPIPWHNHSCKWTGPSKGANNHCAARRTATCSAMLDRIVFLGHIKGALFEDFLKMRFFIPILRAQGHGLAMRASIASLAALILTASIPSSISATLTTYTSKEGKVFVVLNGNIAAGDSDQLQQLLKGANDYGENVSGICLNSNGGNLLEGVKLAIAIRFAKIASVVPKGSTCASACFLAFAAGAHKFASYSASVGVHGASDANGLEHDAATVAMAKIIKELGVPASIIGRMVVTPPDRVIWLSPNDLRSMGATMTGDPSQTPTATVPMQIVP